MDLLSLMKIQYCIFTTINIIECLWQPDRGYNNKKFKVLIVLPSNVSRFIIHFTGPYDLYPSPPLTPFDLSIDTEQISPTDTT